MKYTKPKISIIIPTINRERFLYDTVKDLSKQKIENFEIIVIDQNKKINLLFYQNLKKKFYKINIKIYFQYLSNSSAARNLGVKQSQSDLILFLDDDLKINNRNFLKNHIKNYNSPAIYIVAGKIIEKDNKHNTKNFFYRFKFFLFKNDWRLFRLDSYNSVKKFKIGRSANLSMRKKTFIKLKGMDTNFVKGAHREETDFLFRAFKQNIKIKFDPNSEVIHLKSNLGGIRNFSKYEKIFLEMYGEIYFNIKHFFHNNVIFSFLIILRKYFFNKLIFLKPHEIILNLFIFITCFFFALNKLIFSKNKIYKFKKIL